MQGVAEKNDGAPNSKLYRETWVKGDRITYLVFARDVRLHRLHFGVPDSSRVPGLFFRPQQKIGRKSERGRRQEEEAREREPLHTNKEKGNGTNTNKREEQPQKEREKRRTAAKKRERGRGGLGMCISIVSLSD